MSDYFNSKLCDKSIKNKSKKKHLNSLNHKFLSINIISRYCVRNPNFLQIDNILQNYVLDYNKKFAFHLIICNFQLNFTDTIVSVKSNTWSNLSTDFHLRNLLSKIKYYEKRGHKFSQISEMNITFVTDLRNMTYEHYLHQPKSMMEWKLNAILAKNPELIKILGNRSHPLIRKYQHIYEDDGEN